MQRKPMIERYHDQEERRKACGPLGRDFYKRYMKPFNMWGNLWYVGDNWCSSYIVDTGDGLLMLDAGCPAGAIAMTIQTIWEAGFNPRDVKWLVLDHEHIDHIGAAGFMQKMFGTKLVTSAAAARTMREHPEWTGLQDSSDCFDEVFVPDIEVNEGDILHFGKVTMEFKMAPGHMPGAMAMFFNLEDGEETRRAGFFGAHGVNTITNEYLDEIGDYDRVTRQIFLESCRRMRQEKVDIFVSGHTGMNKILAKLEQWKEDPEVNPFDNPENWNIFFDNKIAEIEAFIKDPTRGFKYGVG
ncbi:MAG: MBL fold metallo-hydrolase [Solobacterium sp.]|nr:MBL fold metallo-hydrolase [Solobacterium sp.]